MEPTDYDEIYDDGAVPTQLDEPQLDGKEGNTPVKVINNVANLDEHRRLAALDFAARANSSSVEEMLDGAAKIAAYLSSGEINRIKGPEGTNDPLV